MANAQDRKRLIQRAEARSKSLNLVDFPNPNGHMDMGINSQINPTRLEEGLNIDWIESTRET